MPLDVRDVQAAIGEIAVGAECPWAGYGREEWAYGIIAQRAREIAGRRKEREAVRPMIRRAANAVSGATIREAADELAKWKAAASRTADEVQAWLDERIPVDESDRRERYKCLRCRDTGLVVVLSAIKRLSGRIVHSTGVAQCPCDVGTEQHRRAANPVPMFDDVEHVRLRIGATGEEAAAAVLEARSRRVKQLEEPSFVAWNNRTFA